MHGDSQRRFEQACEWFVRLREQSESTELISEWLEWLDSDPCNQEAFNEARGIWQVTAGARESKGSSALARIPRTSWLTAASVAFAVVIGGLAWLVEAPHGREFATVQGESRRFELSDGSHVELAGDSKFTVDFSGGVRHIDLIQGEAYFQVAHDKAHPFIVGAGSLHVTAVGTAFNVRTAADRVVVAVEEGIVLVEPRDGDSLPDGLKRIPSLRQGRGTQTDVRRINLGRGEEIAINVGDRQMQMMHIEPSTVASWRSGRLYFAREPLRSVLASVRAASGVEIRIAESSLGDLRFTGTVFNDKVSDWIEGLPAIFPVVIRRDGSAFIVQEKD